MQQQRHGDARVVVEARAGVLGLRGARSALDDRVDELEVARVRVEPDLDLLAALGLHQPLGAMVVLDVAGARRGGSAAIALTCSSALAPSNSAMIDSTERPRLWARTLSRPRWAMPDHDLLGAAPRLRSSRARRSSARRVEPLDREHLLAEVGLLEEALELEDLDQAVQQRALLVRRESGARCEPVSIISRSHIRCWCEERCSIW